LTLIVVFTSSSPGLK